MTSPITDQKWTLGSEIVRRLSFAAPPPPWRWASFQFAPLLRGHLTYAPLHMDQNIIHSLERPIHVVYRFLPYMTHAIGQ
jgi:hypothetical protein